jgi:hypothetical protein
MAIYDFSKAEKEEPELSRFEEEDFSSESDISEALQPKIKTRDRLFSGFAARFFFLVLLIGDLIWCATTILRFCFSLVARLVTADKFPYFKTLGEKAWISLRRSLVCGVSLFLAIFSPAFGIMIACTYFLMYDKSGIEEVIPSSLQSQFREFFPKE